MPTDFFTEIVISATCHVEIVWNGDIMRDLGNKKTISDF